MKLNLKQILIVCTVFILPLISTTFLQFELKKKPQEIFIFLTALPIVFFFVKEIFKPYLYLILLFTSFINFFKILYWLIDTIFPYRNLVKSADGEPLGYVMDTTWVWGTPLAIVGSIIIIELYRRKIKRILNFELSFTILLSLKTALIYYLTEM
tara:strand:+ start:244 stop:705 length:462 start_codon:yes stop_codon:yes gene_type:complete